MYRFILLWFEPHDCVIYSIINSISFEIRNVILVCELQNFRVLGLARVLDYQGHQLWPWVLTEEETKVNDKPSQLLVDPR